MYSLHILKTRLMRNVVFNPALIHICEVTVPHRAQSVMMKAVLRTPVELAFSRSRFGGNRKKFKLRWQTENFRDLGNFWHSKWGP